MVRLSFDKINQLNLPFIDTFEEIGNVRILRFKGSIDSTVLPKILKIKDQMIRQKDINKKNVIIDFKKITHVDSAALGALIIRLSELKRHHKELGLINVTDEMRHMLDIFKTDKYFLIFDSEKAALERLR
jgi:anti-anti-sigma factor